MSSSPGRSCSGGLSKINELHFTRFKWDLLSWNEWVDQLTWVVQLQCHTLHYTALHYYITITMPHTKLLHYYTTITMPRTTLHYYPILPILLSSGINAQGGAFQKISELFIQACYIVYCVYILPKLFCILISPRYHYRGDEYLLIGLSPSFLSSRSLIKSVWVWKTLDWHFP